MTICHRFGEEKTNITSRKSFKASCLAAQTTPSQHPIFTQGFIITGLDTKRHSWMRVAHFPRRNGQQTSSLVKYLQHTSFLRLNSLLSEANSNSICRYNVDRLRPSVLNTCSTSKERRGTIFASLCHLGMLLFFNLMKLCVEQMTFLTLLDWFWVKKGGVGAKKPKRTLTDEVCA
ncbi:hypothetical protein JTE90_003945 [Oedothorax gibbosus]|uniref:Uncharacterized protein n=1 Tax=Oedothorax gibbosus TaxID=931172 RepID=A0AAV6UX39_9ARAC|nr:hypothetical protein JTE90_003945 [Oedothorax gibbosus]